MFVVLFLPSFKREEFFQMFVHGVKEDRPLVLTLWQDETGRALKEAVLKQCPSLPSYFILLFRGRKVRSTCTVIRVRACEQAPGGSLASWLVPHTIPNTGATLLANGVDVASNGRQFSCLEEILAFFPMLASCDRLLV